MHEESTAAPPPRAASPDASAAEATLRTRPHVLPRLRWHDSWIVRLAAVLSLISVLAYGAVAMFAFEMIDTVASLVHREDVERSLGAHLANIKKVHDLRQQLVLERLRPLLPAGPGAVDEATLRGWLEASGAVQALEATAVAVQPATDEQLERAGEAPAGNPPVIAWLDRDRLLVGRLVVEFPKGAAYEAFKAAEDVQQNYLALGVLVDNIRTKVITWTVYIMLASFALLGALVALYSRAFQRRVSQVLEGFREWSEQDTSFRFVEPYTGELQLITSQFNAMADEVEANRQRSLYLEKIASWQIIARKLAHEIKNPLTPIQMMVGQLKRRYKGDDEAFQKLLDNAQSIITEEVAGLRRMVDNFSNFARLPEPQPKPTDLVPLCRHVIELQKVAFERHTWRFDSQTPAVSAVVDDDLLRQVLLNLTKNAAEASSETPATIGITLAETPSDVLIKVQDDGPGIPAEHLGRIFEAYFTTKHTGPSPGMGLGLAVCQKIVMDHDGKMTVQSRPGETVFTIRLPKRMKRTTG